MKTLIPFLMILAAGCGSNDHDTDAPGRSSDEIYADAGTPVLKNWGDVDRYNGKRVMLTGRLSEHIQGIHACLEMESGLKIYLPHFDQHAAGASWFDWIDSTMTVVGILHSYPSPPPVPGRRGPALMLEEFTITAPPGS